MRYTANTDVSTRTNASTRGAGIVAFPTVAKPEGGFNSEKTKHRNSERLKLSGGFSLEIEHFSSAEDSSVNFVSNGDLVFHFHLSGTHYVTSGSRPAQVIEPGNMQIFCYPKGTQVKKEYVKNDVNQSISLFATIEALANIVDINNSMIPDELYRYVIGIDFEPLNFRMAITPEITLAAKGILSCDFSDPIDLIYAEGKVLELLALFIYRIRSEKSKSAEDDKILLTKRNVKCIKRAQRILSAGVSNPPTIPILSRQVGLSPPKLCYGFKQMFGKTLHEYVHSQRMERALEMLRDSDRCISDIGLDVGYDYSSNFTTAFKKYFGMTPLAARKSNLFPTSHS